MGQKLCLLYQEWTVGWGDNKLAESYLGPSYTK